MSEPSLTPEAESLIQGYLEGELSASECGRLRELLDASPELINSILAGLRTDALIRETLLQVAGIESETSQNHEIASKSNASRRVRIGLALAACLMVLAALGAIFLRSVKMGPVPGTVAKGSILYEYWNDITGNAIIDLTSHPAFLRAPNGSELLSNFKAPSNRAPNYGARIRGYVHPPATGDYRFWITADDAGELWLSPDENPTNKLRICFLDSWVPPGEWTFRPSQQSNPIRLKAGKRYYIEALHKQGDAGDALAVAWQPPGKAREIIPGSALSPFSQPSSRSATTP